MEVLKWMQCYQLVAKNSKQDVAAAKFMARLCINFLFVLVAENL